MSTMDKLEVLQTVINATEESSFVSSDGRLCIDAASFVKELEVILTDLESQNEIEEVNLAFDEAAVFMGDPIEDSV